MYKCKCCSRRFTGGRHIDSERVIDDYVLHKMTLRELSDKYGRSVSTIQRVLRKMRHVHTVSKHKDVTIGMDATYWGRGFGLVVIRDAVRGKVLWHKYVRNETIADYMEGIDWLKGHGFRVYGVVCDGLKGLCKALAPIPVQMCQVHQQRIVRTYLTSRPELDASKELLALSRLLTCTEKDSSIAAFDEWHERWKQFLAERSTDKATGKTFYTHRRLRSAYLSLRRNMPYLWTFHDHPERGIPNTNNALEGMFSVMKSMLRVHSGIKREKRMKFLDEYMARH